MPKTKAPPVNLDKYLEGRNHKYMTYEKASRLYGIAKELYSELRTADYQTRHQRGRR